MFNPQQQFPVTWPAEPVDGFVVSSYLPYLFNWSTGRPLKGTIVDGIPQQTYPPELIDELGMDSISCAVSSARARLRR